MIPVILMILATAASVIFLAESGKAGRMAAAEIVLSKAVSYTHLEPAGGRVIKDLVTRQEKGGK